MMDPAPGLLLFAHGARDLAWAAPFEAVVRRCRERDPQRPVALAFLEFMAPDLLTAAADLATAGCRAVDVVPLFLGAGGHVRKDIPSLMARLKSEHPGVRWTLRRPVGEADAVIAALAEAALGAGDGGTEGEP